MSGDLLRRYRRAGADLPFGDPRRAHGVGMEGYYWRLTDAVAGRVVIALCGVARGPGGAWALVTLAAHPDGLLRTAVVPIATADDAGLGVRAGAALSADSDRLRVDLGPDARLDVALHERREWPRQVFGGLGPAQAIPGLGQYWHPHLLGARVTGEASLGDRTVRLDGATAYAEKNWGAHFAERWWWGQAQGFAEDPELCVAFAGGRLRLAGIAAAPTAVVVSAGGTLLRLSPPFARTLASTGQAGWRVRAWGARHRVELEGEAGPAGTLALDVPLPGGPPATELRSRQGLAGRLSVRVFRGGRLLRRDESRLAGLEHAA